MVDKNDDPEYRMIHYYLNYHHAPQIIHSALERIIERTGLRIPPEKPITKSLSATKIKKKPDKKKIKETSIKLEPHIPMKRDPVNEYFDKSLGMMIKVYHTAYARLR